MDDLLAGSFKNLQKNRILADGVRTIGHLLLGYQSWSFSKAEEEVFFAHLHKYTGIVLNTSLSSEPRASFTSDRIAKCLEIVRTVLDDITVEEWPISFFQSGHGNLQWFQKVYYPFRAYTAAYRRPLMGISTHADAATLISPKHDKESQKEGARKFVKDNKTCEIMLMHLEHIQKVYGENSMGATVPFTGMLHINYIEDIDSDVSIGSIGGDASGRSWCVINHRTNKMLIMLMPHALVEVIGNRSTLLEGDIRRKFMISIAEHLVLIFALLQWGQEWKDDGTQVVRYMTDNQNSYVWTTKGFAGCEVAQDLCRLMSVLELIFGIKILPGYINTKINVIADYGSRIYLPDGKIDYGAKLEFEAENKKAGCALCSGGRMHGGAATSFLFRRHILSI